METIGTYHDLGNSPAAVKNRCGMNVFFGLFSQKTHPGKVLQVTDSNSSYTDFSIVSFTGKETDCETGYSYFGARYYDPTLLTSWTAVDPMADKYPSLSPYNYCAWNPMKLVDPDGEEMWKPEMLEDGAINYVMEKGDNVKTLQSQYDISKRAASQLFNTLKNGKISGMEVKRVTGNEVLKLRTKNVSNSKFLYHLGFSIMYNHEKMNDNLMKLNDFFSGLPQEVGANCQKGTRKYLSDIVQSIFGGQNETFSVPIKGGKSIPVTFFDFSATGNWDLIRDCYGIQSKKEGTVNFLMRCYKPGTGCNNGAPAVIIQVPQKFEDIFTESYGS